MLAELGCDLEQTYFDVPRLRTMAPASTSTPGSPTSSTRTATPGTRRRQQLNWWMPVYAIESENSMAFHPQYFDQPVRNSSAGYNYYEWNKTGRQQAAKQVKTETREQPRPRRSSSSTPDVRVVTPARRRPRLLGRAAALDGARTRPAAPASASTSVPSTSTT